MDCGCIDFSRRTAWSTMLSSRPAYCDARRAETDRLDAFGLLRVRAAKFASDPDACRIVVVPTVEEEDAKRPHREREFLVQERERIENRIAALLLRNARAIRRAGTRAVPR